MSTQLRLRRLSGACLLSLALAGTVVTPAPAQAAPAVQGGLASSIGLVGADDGCTVAPDAPVQGPPATFADDGVAAASEASFGGTAFDAAGVVDASGTVKLTALASPPSAATPSITFTGSGYVQSVARSAAATCTGRVRALATAEGTFTLAAPRWVTVTTVSEGDGSVGGGISTAGGGVVATTGDHGTPTSRSFLPAGTYVVSAIVTVQTTRAAGPAFVAGQLTIAVEPPGAAGPTYGVGRRLVTLGARDCASNTIAGAITARAPKRARSIVVSVDGQRRVALPKKQLRARSFALAARSDATVTVVARIRMRNKAVLVLTRTYLACS